MKTTTIYLLVLIALFLPMLAEAQVSNATYACDPVFISDSVAPNVLILLDTSWEMNSMAYGWENADELYRPNSFNPATTYTGYFNPVQKYNYAGGEFDMAAGGSWDGNFLNWLSMRRIDIARKVLVGGLATSRTGGGNTKLYGETPPTSGTHDKYWKFFKFYQNSGTYTPYNNNHIYKISKGKIEVYEINTPAGLLQNSDFKTYCRSNDDYGHEAFMEAYYFEYNGNSVQDQHPYNVYDKSGATGGCGAGFYDLASVKTTLTYVATFEIKVDKEEAEEPALFDDDGNISGLLQMIDDKARFGTMWFNDGEFSEPPPGGTPGNQDGGSMQKYVDSTLTASNITTIQNKQCSDFSPIAEAFFDGLAYYMQNGTYSGSWAGHDPFDYPGAADVGCGNNFILIIGGGESSMDINIPQYTGAFGFVPDLRDYDEDSGGDDGTGSAANNWGTDYLDDIALWANTTDLRPPGATEVDEFNNVITYAVSAFGSATGTQLLKDACKNGGFVDRDGDSVPDTVGDARGGDWADLGNNLEWDDDGDGDPDTYFEAQDSGDLEAKILEALNAILKRAASGTAVSILSTSSEGEGSLFQAFFKPKIIDNLREIEWTGYLNALWVDPYGNIREDTVQDDALVYTDDKIIKFTVDAITGDTAIERYHDSDGDGQADSVTPYETALLTEIQPQWEAGEIMALSSAADRDIYTWVDINGNGERDEGPPDEFMEFTTANAAVLRPFLGVATVGEAEDIIEFIRGEEIAGFRDRNINIGGTEYVWKLGDVVYSTPTVVGEPMERYNQIYSDVTYGAFFTKWEERGVTVYVGANDGMLHAFKAGTFTEGDNSATALKEEHGWYSTTEDPATTEGVGDERWAFIPYSLLPHLRWLTQPDYEHVFYVDLKPKVTDVRIFLDGAGNPIDANHPDGWGTLLIGGMRLGGGANSPLQLTDDFGGPLGVETRTFYSSYFALDITIPDSPVFLGEFSDANLAFTTSYPAIARVADDDDPDEPGNWYIIVGSGPTDCDGTSDQQGRVFVLDLNGASLLGQTFTTTEGDALMAHPVTMDLNLNYSTDAIYIGNAYVAGGDKGKMYRISTRSNNNPAPDADPWPYKYDISASPWVMTTLFESATPVTASPTASIDEDDNIWVYFGTGKYYNDTDKLDNTQQFFYGIKDACAYGVCGTTVTLAELYDSTSIIVLTNEEVVNATATTWDAFIPEVQAEKGWYLDLTAGGERQLTRPSILGGVVLFAPFTPDGDICGYGGTGAVYALYYETGTAFPEDILGTDPYGASKQESLKKIELGKGLTSEIGLHVGQKATSTGFIQQGTGTVVQVEVDPALGIKSGIIGWKQY